MVPTAIFGGGLLLAGTALSVYVLVADNEPGHNGLRIGNTIIIIGVLLVTYAGLRRKGRSIEEAYRLGYDIGFENGFHAHVEDLIERIEDDIVAGPTRRRRTARRRREHPAVAELNGERQ